MPSTQQAPPHLLHLTPAEQKEFLDSFDTVICDCDGVVWLLIDSIPRVGEALNALYDSGKKCKFVSNNSVRTDDEYLRKFMAMGVEYIEKDDLMHPVKAMINYLKKHKPGEQIFSICSLEANKAFQEAGIEVKTIDCKEHLTSAPYGKLLKTEDKVAVVTSDIHLDLNYLQLVKAYQYLRQKDCILLTGATDSIIPLAPNLHTTGFIDFYEYLERYSRKEAISLGKPSPHLAKIMKEVFNVTKPKRCLFVGDSLLQDIQFGKSSGMQTLLVLTGVTSKEAMLAAVEKQRPDFYIDGIVDFIEFFQKYNKRN